MVLGMLIVPYKMAIRQSNSSTKKTKVYAAICNYFAPKLIQYGSNLQDITQANNQQNSTERIKQKKGAYNLLTMNKSEILYNHIAKPTFYFIKYKKMNMYIYNEIRPVDNFHSRKNKKPTNLQLTTQQKKLIYFLQKLPTPTML